jgi:Uncharacterised nucleotidyltransferase
MTADPAGAPSNEGIRAEAETIVRAANTNGLLVRIIGGLAIAIHSPTAGRPPLSRSYEDIDIVVHKKGRGGIDKLLAELGWQADRRFNALNGEQRRIYERPDGQKIDAFVGTFSMCHEIPLDEKRFAADDPTAPVAELVLMKAQIVHLTHKDLTDLAALLADHEVADTDEDAINAARVAELCGRDWGLWRTVTGTLQRVADSSAELGLPEAESRQITDRVAALRDAIDAAPKSSKWKMRNRIGDRVTWYELPEDPARDSQY